MTDEVDNVYKNQQSVKFLRGDWNALLLIHDNFIYQRFNGNFPGTTWRCKTTQCEVTVSTNAGIFVEGSLSSPHEHPSSTDDIVLLETKMRIKKRVKTEFNLSPRQIHSYENFIICTYFICFSLFVFEGYLIMVSCDIYIYS